MSVWLSVILRFVYWWYHPQWPWVTQISRSRYFQRQLLENNARSNDRIDRAMTDCYTWSIDSSAGATFNDFELPLTQNSRSRHYSSLNVRMTQKHWTIETSLQWNTNTHALYSRVSFRMTMSDLGKCSIQSDARPLCDSWAFCLWLSAGMPGQIRFAAMSIRRRRAAAAAAAAAASNWLATWRVHMQYALCLCWA